MTPLFVNLTNHSRVNQGTKEGCACNRVQARVPLMNNFALSSRAENSAFSLRGTRATMRGNRVQSSSGENKTCMYWKTCTEQDLVLPNKSVNKDVGMINLHDLLAVA